MNETILIHYSHQKVILNYFGGHCCVTCSVRACSKVMLRFNQARSSPALASSSWFKAFWISDLEL